MRCVTNLDNKAIKLPNNYLKDRYISYFNLNIINTLIKIMDNAIIKKIGENEINSMLNAKYRNISALLTVSYDTKS